MKPWLAIVKPAIVVVAAATPALAHAQLDDRTVVSVLRECRKIADPAARTACYDNIPLAQEASAAPAPAAAAPAAPTAPAGGFGSNQLPQRERPADGGRERIAATLASAEALAPGVYLLTLEDGAQWRFVDAVPSSYDPPRRGATVEIAAAALGSYLMTYAGQRSVRIRRTR